MRQHAEGYCLQHPSTRKNRHFMATLSNSACTHTHIGFESENYDVMLN